MTNIWWETTEVKLSLTSLIKRCFQAAGEGARSLNHSALFFNYKFLATKILKQDTYILGNGWSSIL
jgi:hypothetical protein